MTGPNVGLAATEDEEEDTALLTLDAEEATDETATADELLAVDVFLPLLPLPLPPPQASRRLDKPIRDKVDRGDREEILVMCYFLITGKIPERTGLGRLQQFSLKSKIFRVNTFNRPPKAPN